MFSPPALGPPGGLGAGTKDTLASLGHDGKRTSPLTPSSTRRASAPLRRGFLLLPAGWDFRERQVLGTRSG
jgi:hypothetical protein